MRIRLSGALVASVLVAAAAAGCTKKTAIAPEAVVKATEPTPNTLTVTAPQPELFQRGSTAQFRAIVTMSNGFTEDRTSSVSWSSDNSAVASVNSSGLVTAGDEGTATISASLQSLRGTFALRVRNAFRSPDPPPGQRLPQPNVFGVIQQYFFANPALVARSCQDAGGTWEYMDGLVDRLRLIDLRWGYNGRRGDANFVARDEIAYHWGAGPSLNSREVYVWDTMGGHCGPTPTPVYFDISDLGGIWLGRGRFTSLEDATLFVKP